jgi:hypothetical protein
MGRVTVRRLAWLVVLQPHLHRERRGPPHHWEEGVRQVTSLVAELTPSRGERAREVLTPEGLAANWRGVSSELGRG